VHRDAGTRCCEAAWHSFPFRPDAVWARPISMLAQTIRRVCDATMARYIRKREVRRRSRDGQTPSTAPDSGPGACPWTAVREVLAYYSGKSGSHLGSGAKTRYRSAVGDVHPRRTV
jgi:hypothetical protein